MNREDLEQILYVSIIKLFYNNLNGDPTAESAGIFDDNPLYVVDPGNNMFKIQQNDDTTLYFEMTSNSTIARLKEALSNRIPYLRPENFNLYEAHLINNKNQLEGIFIKVSSSMQFVGCHMLLLNGYRMNLTKTIQEYNILTKILLFMLLEEKKVMAIHNINGDHVFFIPFLNVLIIHIIILI